MKLVQLSVFMLGIVCFLHAQQLAFPSAEGYGKYTTGGTGGKVVIVKSLGEFGSALKTSGKKTIVFQCAGEVKAGGIPSGTTILGQTAPGDGITIRGGISLSNDVILRYIRVRGPAGDNIGKTGGSDIILDHVSTSWSTDESISIYHCKNVTIQWTLIAEPLGPEHAFGGIWGGPNNTYHHNMFAHCQSRAPRFTGGVGNCDYRNNVNYNWERANFYGNEKKSVNSGDQGWSHANIVANYYKSGPATYTESVKSRIADVCWGKFNNNGVGKFYITDNYVHGYPEVTKDNWDGGEFGGAQCVGGDPMPGVNEIVIHEDRSMRVDEPSEFMPIKQQTAEDAFESVLKHVGCSFPNRDDLDKAVIEEARTGTAKRGKDGKGILYNASQIVRPTLKSGTPAIDSDNDGMADNWETKNGCTVGKNDANEIGKDGFTNIVLYSESLVDTMFRTSLEKWAAQKKFKLEHSVLSYGNSSPTIEYQLPSRSKVTLEVFDVAGKNVATLVNEVQGPGKHSFNFKSSHLSTGFYAYKFTTNNRSITRKMFLVQ